MEQNAKMNIKTDGAEEAESSVIQKGPAANEGGFGVRKRISASSLFDKKFSNTSRFVVSSQVWMHTIPTRNCDVLVTFPSDTTDETLMWVLSRLKSRTPELICSVHHHGNTKSYGFYLTATYENLLKGAEELSLRKPVKPEYGGGMKEFVFEDQEYFEGLDDDKSFLVSQERQNIVHHYLLNLRATEGDVIGNLRFLDGQAIIPVLLSKGIIKGVFPLHNNDNLEVLRKTWVQAFFQTQPKDLICEYFGVKIAMYFAYLGHYTKALMIPTVLGIAMWFISDKSQYTDDVCFVLFAFINVIWATLYLERWKRQSAVLAYNWGTLDKEDELLVEPRPLYHGYIIKSAVTGRFEPHYPTWKRLVFRYCVSVPVIFLCLSVVFATMWGIFELQDWINMKVTEGHAPSLTKFIPKILLAVCIGLLDDVYKKIAYWLNEKENYRLQETYENNLIIKLILFQFVNSFLSLFYIAFYLQDMDRLKEQLAALLITRQVIGNIKEALVPFVISKIKLFRMGLEMTEGMDSATMEKQAKNIIEQNKTKFKNWRQSSSGGLLDSKGGETDECSQNNGHSSEESGENGETSVQAVGGEEGGPHIAEHGPHLTQAEVEASMKEYEDTLEDYLEMLVQFGYVTLFSSAFPLAALCALLNNIIEIRTDAFKLCMTFRRPFGQRVENIGIWQDALEIMSIIAVMVNCALVGFSGLSDRLYPDARTAYKIIFIVILEHIILVLRLWLAYVIPDVPQWVAEEKARLEFLRRDALKKLGTRNGHDSPKLEDTATYVSTKYSPTPNQDSSPERNRGPKISPERISRRGHQISPERLSRGPKISPDRSRRGHQGSPARLSRPPSESEPTIMKPTKVSIPIVAPLSSKSSTLTPSGEKIPFLVNPPRDRSRSRSPDPNTEKPKTMSITPGIIDRL